MENGSQRIVAAAFIRKADSVLLARRSLQKSIAPGRYHLPGGHVEFGESIEQAIVREIREECGLDIYCRHPISTFTYTHQGCHTIGVVYWSSLLIDDQQLTYDRDDNEEIIWVTQSEALDYLSEPRDHNYDAVAEGFRVTG